MSVLSRNKIIVMAQALMAAAIASCSSGDSTAVDTPSAVKAAETARSPIAKKTPLAKKTKAADAVMSLKPRDYLEQDCPVMRGFSHKVTGPLLTFDEYNAFFDERPMMVNHSRESMDRRIVIRGDIKTEKRRGLNYRSETLTGSRTEGITKTGIHTATKLKHHKSAYRSKKIDYLWNEKCRSFLFLQTLQEDVDLHEDDFEVTYYMGQNRVREIEPSDVKIDKSVVSQAMKWGDNPAVKTVISRSCWRSPDTPYDMICGDHYLSLPGERPMAAKFRLLDK